MPQRIQRKRTKGWRMPAGAVYVGRPTKWGNPWYYAPGKEGRRGYYPCVSRDEAFECYELMMQHVTDDATPVENDHPVAITLADIRRELRGKNLVCWCPPGSACHADVLLSLANHPES